jgi:hypothetical protein
LGKVAVRRYDYQLFRKRLGDQQAIKGITMVEVEFLDLGRMTQLNVL